MRPIARNIVDLVAGDNWPKRRRVIHWTLMFCACLITAAMGAAIADNDMTAVLNLAGSAFLLGGSTIGSYVFGSIWDDRDKRKRLAEPSDPVEPAEPEVKE